jgi:starch synthase
MPPRTSQKILIAASEVAGFAKTGGLADVTGSLPRALAERGHECVVMLPLYRCARSAAMTPVPTEHLFTISMGGRDVAGRLWRSALPGSAVPVYLIEQADYFERDDPQTGGGLYQFTGPHGQKLDYPDNCERFVFFCRAILESLPLLNFWPAVIHDNDWQTGLLPVYLREKYRHDANYAAIRTIITIHNMAYQGRFRHWEMGVTGLDWSLFNSAQLEWHGYLNCLKAGIVFSDAITTVSPTYAKEIQTPEFGFGLEGVLAERHDRCLGIVNGVDYGIWNPAADPLLAARYDADSVWLEKPTCKAAIEKRFRLDPAPMAPLLAMISRLIEQKGLDLVFQTADALLADGARIIILGQGERVYESMARALQDRFPGKVGIHLGFDEALAHQIEAGSDIFLMPSRFEPSGLNQLYSLKYGTVPVVHAVGGLADTIVDCTPANLESGKATGFTFAPFDPEIFLQTVRRAMMMYCRQPADWRRLVRTGMEQNWSWDRSAVEYERVYEQLTLNDDGNLDKER